MLKKGIHLGRLIHHQTSFGYKKWAELSLSQKQDFVRRFVDNYSIQYPGSKTNVSLKGLAFDMEKHGDAPSVFGIFYEDILKLFTKSRNNLYSSEKPTFKGNSIKELGRYAHESFYDLLVGDDI